MILITLGLLLAFLTACLQRIHQDPCYHHFADDRKLYGIPNFWNVITNLPFCLLGLWALIYLSKPSNQVLFSNMVEKRIWAFLFAGVFLVGLGSGYYHLHPCNETLVWDRIPMSLVFMSFFALLLAERLDTKIGVLALPLLNLVGILSVLYWYVTEESGRGDLRFYGFIQFAPMILIPALLLMTKGPKLFPDLIFVFLFYAGAKLAERYDPRIYCFTGFSGHALKHLLASGAVFYMFHILVSRKHAILKPAGDSQP